MCIRDRLDWILSWYLEQYLIAQADILLERRNGSIDLRIDNGLLSGNRTEGLFLQLPRLVRPDVDGNYTPVHSTVPPRASSPALPCRRYWRTRMLYRRKVSAYPSATT